MSAAPRDLRSAVETADARDGFDAIVIGSGIGGLAYAAMAARSTGARVLVLERYAKLGGFTHAFTRWGTSFDVGLHYVGHMAPGTAARTLMDYATGGQVEWTPMPDRFDVSHLPGITYGRPSSRERWRDELIERFPHERDGIVRYLRAVEHAAGWYGATTWSWSSPRPLRLAVRIWGARRRRLALATTEQVVNRYVTDPTLRSLLTAAWFDYGLPPSRSAFAAHAMISSTYDDGAHVPVGGAARIGAAMVAIIEAHGGSCRTGHEVRRIIVERGRAVGVEVHTRRGTLTFRSPLVVSDVGLHGTYRSLLGDRSTPPAVDEVLRDAAVPSAATLFCSLRGDVRELGIDGANQWCFDTIDHDDTGDPMGGRPVRAYLSLSQVNDPTNERPGAQIMTSLDRALVARWAGQPWKHRDDDYQALKAAIAQGLLDLVDRHVPGFSGMVDRWELSTPLTIESLHGHHGGALYGLPATPERYRLAHGATTGIDGLVLTGADVCSPGIEGALMGAAYALGTRLGPFGLPTLLRRAGAAHPVAAVATTAPTLTEVGR